MKSSLTPEANIKCATLSANLSKEIIAKTDNSIQALSVVFATLSGVILLIMDENTPEEVIDEIIDESVSVMKKGIRQARPVLRGLK